MNILKYEMKKNRYSGIELAKALGVSETTVTMWLTGKYRPGMENIDKMISLGFSEDACIDPTREKEF